MNWFNKWIWQESDKVYHAYLHTVIILVASLGFGRSILFSCIVSIVWGVLWEVKDKLKKKPEGFSWMDILANFSGLFVGVALVIIIGWLKQIFME